MYILLHAHIPSRIPTHGQKNIIPTDKLSSEKRASDTL